MFSTLGRYLKKLLGPRKIEILDDRPERVSLRCGPTVFIIDRNSEQVTKDGQLVAMIPLITEVTVYQAGGHTNTTVWNVSCTVTGRRTVEFGRAYSKEEATHIAGIISVLIKKPVKIER
jgi:hypothetical protein